MQVSDIISLFALFLSGMAIWYTYKADKRERDKDKKELENEKKADLRARVVKYGKSCKVQIWNQGKCIARNVDFEILGENVIFSKSQIKETFPVDLLEPHDPLKLIAINYIGMKKKHQVKLSWSDDYKDNNVKNVCLVV